MAGKQAGSLPSVASQTCPSRRRSQERLSLSGELDDGDLLTKNNRPATRTPSKDIMMGWIRCIDVCMHGPNKYFTKSEVSKLNINVLFDF